MAAKVYPSKVSAVIMTFAISCLVFVSATPSVSANDGYAELEDEDGEGNVYIIRVKAQWSGAEAQAWHESYLVQASPTAPLNPYPATGELRVCDDDTIGSCGPIEDTCDIPGSDISPARCQTSTYDLDADLGECRHSYGKTIAAATGKSVDQFKGNSNC